MSSSILCPATILSLCSVYIVIIELFVCQGLLFYLFAEDIHKHKVVVCQFKMPPQYQQRFRKEWLKDPLFKDWLTEVPGESGKAKCKFCKSVFHAKHSDLVQHTKTKKHISSTNISSSSRKLDEFVMSTKDTQKVGQAEASLALFVACHSSIHIIDDLSELCKSTFNDSQTAAGIKIHRTKCSAIMKFVLAPHFEKLLLEDIGNGPFSILIDESNDISVIKMLGIAIVYFSRSKTGLTSTFLSLSELQNCDAQSISACVLQTLRDKGLNIKNLKGIGVDNASVMTGINNGVCARLQNECPSLIMIRCVCHSLQLAISSASQCLPMNLDFLVRETYNWFAHSAVRQCTYKSLFAAINDGHEPRKIVQVCQTRWLSIESAVARIVEQWLELSTMFGIAKSKERDYTASLLHSMYLDQKNFAYLIFLRPVLAEVQRVNKSFEAQAADPSKLLEDLTVLVEGTAKKFVLPTCRKDFLTENLESYIHYRAYLGFEVEEKLHNLRLSTEEETEFRKRCITFLLKLHSELQARLPENVKVLRHISVLSVSNSLRPMKESLVPIMKHLQVPSETITKAEFQWQNLTSVKWKETSDTLSFWHEVANYKDASGVNPFQCLVDVATSLLVLPWSNAEVERIFSTMNIIKNKLRNRMSSGVLNAIITIKAGLSRMGKCCKDYKFPSEVLSKVGTMAAYKSDTTDNVPTTSAASSRASNISSTTAGATSFISITELDSETDDPTEILI